MNTTLGYQLVQTHNGGKIHDPGCGHRSYSINYIVGSESMTREQVVAKYGTDLCRFCFPEVNEIAAAAPAPAPAPAKTYRPASGTRDWKFGEPERKTYFSPGGTCGHCGKWVGQTSRYNPTIRKHAAA